MAKVIRKITSSAFDDACGTGFSHLDNSRYAIVGETIYHCFFKDKGKSGYCRWFAGGGKMMDTMPEENIVNI